MRYQVICFQNIIVSQPYDRYFHSKKETLEEKWVMDPKQPQNLAEQFPLDVKTREQSSGLDSVPLSPPGHWLCPLIPQGEFLFTTAFQGCPRKGRWWYRCPFSSSACTLCRIICKPFLRLLSSVKWLEVSIRPRVWVGRKKGMQQVWRLWDLSFFFNVTYLHLQDLLQPDLIHTTSIFDRVLLWMPDFMTWWIG